MYVCAPIDFYPKPIESHYKVWTLYFTKKATAECIAISPECIVMNESVKEKKRNRNREKGIKRVKGEKSHCKPFIHAFVLSL